MGYNHKAKGCVRRSGNIFDDIRKWFRISTGIEQQ